MWMVDEEEDGAYHLLYTKAWDDDVGINWVSVDLDANSPTVNSSLREKDVMHPGIETHS